MKASGAILARVKKKLKQQIKSGVTSLELDRLADKIITQAGAKSSFKTVPGYDYTTCININEGMVHGLPNNLPLKPSDVVTVDCGVYLNGYHTDSSFTVQIPPLDGQTTKFLETGRRALKKAIQNAKPGKSVYDISLAMQQTAESEGYSVSTDLTGHGVGKKLHEYPNISCYAREEDKKIILRPDQTLAIEIMYAAGSSKLQQAPDGWTLSTVDCSLSGMFEETVYITENSPLILTQ